MAVIEGQGDNDDAEFSLKIDDFSDSVPKFSSQLQMPTNLNK